MTMANSELERTCKETVVAYIGVLSLYSGVTFFKNTANNKTALRKVKY
jgi:hypothetical protein